MMVCAFEDCGRPAHEKWGRLCAGHRAQKERGESLQSLRPWGQTEEQAYWHALDRYMNASSEDDEEFCTVKEALRRAMFRYVKGELRRQGWKSPSEMRQGQRDKRRLACL